MPLTYRQARDIAHDIRMPQKTKNLFDRLLDHSADADMSEALTEIRSCWASRVDGNINHIVELSKIVEEELFFPLDVNPFIRKAVNEVLSGSR